MANFIRYSRLISGRSVTKGANKPSNPKSTGGGGGPVRGGAGGAGGLKGMTVSTVAGGVSTIGGGFSIAGVTASVGDMLVAFISLNYTGTPNLTIDDGGTGNVWNIRESSASGQAAQILIADCRVTVAYSAANIDFVSSTGTYQAGKMYKIVPDAGGVPEYVSKGTTQASAATTTHSASTVSVTDKQVIFGAASINTDDVVTEDSDTTNGSWSTNITIYADGGTEPNTGSLSAQWKVVNATGNQSWAVTTVSSRVSARNYAIYQVV